MGGGTVAERVRPTGRALVGGVRGVPAGHADGVPDAPPGPGRPPARPCSWSASARACRAPPWPSPGTSAPTWWPPAAAPTSASRRLAMGAVAAIDSAAERWPCRPTSWSRASARRRGTVGALAEGRRAAGRVRRHVGGRGDAQPAPPVLQAVRDHRLVDGQLPGVRRGHPAGRRRPRRARRPVVRPRRATRPPSPASKPASNSARSSSPTDPPRPQQDSTAFRASADSRTGIGWAYPDSGTRNRAFLHDFACGNLRAG